MSELLRVRLPDGRTWTKKKGWHMKSGEKKQRQRQSRKKTLFSIPKFTKEARWHVRELAYSLLDAGREEETPGFTNLVKTASRLHAVDRTTNMGSLSEDLMTAAGRLLRAAQIRDVGHALLNAVEEAPADGTGLPWIRRRP